MAEHYQRPGWFTTNVFSRLAAALTRLGVSAYGSRGHAQWVKNLRVSSSGRLRVGRRTEPFTAVELADDELRRIAAEHPVFRLTEG